MEKKYPTFKISRYQNVIFFLFAVGLLIYTSYRATYLSMTCDEASTYFSHVPNSIFKCFFSNSCWIDANNHLLNTFLMQLSIGIFGVSEWTLRLPNLCGHFIYLVFSIFIVTRYSKNFWISLVGFCFLNLNPFLIEFFSLARGYGLGVGMMMMSIYYLLRWIEDYNLKMGVYCFIGAILAVLSNFVFLNYWASLSGVFGLLILNKYFFREMNSKRKFDFISLVIPLISAIVLFVFLKTPINHLSSKGEFDYGYDSFIESFESLVKLSVMSQGYFNPFTTNVFILFSSVLLGLTTISGVFYFFKNPKSTFSKIQFGVVGLMVLIMMSTVVQYYLLGVQYLQGRKAIMLLPVFGIVGYVFFEYLSKKINPKMMIVIAIFISVFSWNHFYRTFDLKETVEWKYDAYTKDMVNYLDETLPENKKSHVAVYFIFEPATHFYQEQFSLDRIGRLSRVDDGNLGREVDADYLYVQKKDIQKVASEYVFVKEFGGEGVLFARSTTL